MDNFYMTLPSNVKSDYFENTIANYKTKLAIPIELNGEWEVGLSQFIFTKSWYTIVKRESMNLRYFAGGTRIVKDIQIVKGHYNTIETLIEAINNKWDEAEVEYSIDCPRLELHPQTSRINIRRSIHNNRLVFPEFSLDLCEMLGFDKAKMDADTGKTLILYETELNTVEASERPNWNPEEAPKELNYWSEKPYDITGNLHSLFVYCDIVRPSFVGDSFTQLLSIATVPPQYKFGQTINIAYNPIQYCRILNKQFESIEIDIKDDTGRQIPFEFGRSIVVLHFRKKL
jgi:hypothetical protein